MSGKRIAFRQRVILQDHIESKSYSSVTELAKLLKISRNALYEELKKHRISRGSKQSKFLHENLCLVKFSLVFLLFVIPVQS